MAAMRNDVVDAARGQGVETRHWELRPDQIASKRFSTSLRGVNRREVRAELSAVALALDRSREALTLCRLQTAALRASVQRGEDEIERCRFQTAALRASVQRDEDEIERLKHLLAAANAEAEARREAIDSLKETRVFVERATRAAEQMLVMGLKGVRMEAGWLTESVSREGATGSQDTVDSLSTLVAAVDAAIIQLSARGSCKREAASISVDRPASLER